MSDPVETPVVKNADIVINKGGVLYRTYSFKPSKQTELATATADIAALKTGNTNVGSRVDALETAINGNGSDVAGIEARLSAQETAWSTFFEGETDNSKIDTLKELLSEINTNTTNIADLLSNKVAKADVVDETTGTLTGKVASAQLAKNIEDRVAANETAISTNASAIQTNTTAISTNASAIQTNANNISALDTKVDGLIHVVNALPQSTTDGVTYVVVDE